MHGTNAVAAPPGDVAQDGLLPFVLYEACRSRGIHLSILRPFPVPQPPEGTQNAPPVLGTVYLYTPTRHVYTYTYTPRVGSQRHVHACRACIRATRPVGLVRGVSAGAYSPPYHR